MKLKFWKKTPSLSLYRNLKKRRRHSTTTLQGPLIVPVLAIVMSEVAAQAVATVISSVLVIASLAYSIASALFSVGTSSQDENAARGTGTGGFGSRDPMSSGHLLNTRSSSEPIPINYGESRIGQNFIFEEAVDVILHSGTL